MKGALSTSFWLAALLLVCWGLTLGLTWAPCYAQVCPEDYHPLATRMHIVAFYGLLVTLIVLLLPRAFNRKYRAFSERHLATREVPILRTRITVGGLVFALWVSAVVLATTAYWIGPLLAYWTARCNETGWSSEMPKLVIMGIFAHHADFLLGLLLIPVGRNSLIGRAFHLHQHTLLYAHKLFAYCTVLMALAHGVAYYPFVAAWMARPFKPYENLMAHLQMDVENPNIALTDVKRLGYYYAVSLFTGTLTFAIMLVVVISSLPFLRRRAYNTFYYLHIIFGSLIFIGAGIHSSTNFYFMLPGLFLWLTDWVWRLFRGDTGLVHAVDGSLEDAGNGWLRISLPPSVKQLPHGHLGQVDGERGMDRQMVAHPLQTYYLNVPSVSKLQNHAYSAAAVGSESAGPVILFQRTAISAKSERKRERAMKKQWTWKVGNLTTKSHGDDPSGLKHLRLRVEGPYLSPDRDFETVDKIVCIVGGTGVTGALSLAEWFLTHRMPESKATFTVVWTIHTAGMAGLREWQHLLERSLETNERLRLKTHVSSEYGRLNIEEVLRVELAEASHHWAADGGQAGQGSAWVYISGPRGLLTDAEDACCDIEAELRAARKAKAASGFKVAEMSHFAAKWEV